MLLSLYVNLRLLSEGVQEDQNNSTRGTDDDDLPAGKLKSNVHHHLPSAQSIWTLAWASLRLLVLLGSLKKTKNTKQYYKKSSGKKILLGGNMETILIFVTSMFLSLFVNLRLLSEGVQEDQNNSTRGTDDDDLPAGKLLLCRHCPCLPRPTLWIQGLAQGNYWWFWP